MLVLAFLGVSLVIICTPGPDTALTVRNALTGGLRGGVLTAAGVAVGQLTWTIASAVGLAALVQTSQTVLSGLKVVGGLYLIYLGVRSVIKALKRGEYVLVPRSGPALEGSAALRQGLLSNLANPKMVAFFLSVLPQFVPAGWTPLAGFTTLGVLFCALTFGWLSMYAIAVDRGRAVLSRPSVRKALDLVAGTLVALGVRLALQAGRT